MEFGLGGDTWQQFVDRYKEKYEGMIIDGFEFAPTSINYTWQQLVAATTVTTLPTYVDPESPGTRNSVVVPRVRLAAFPLRRPSIR